jgi:CHAT domain-containing protein/Tfp pilus assembly protein PilF
MLSKIQIMLYFLLRSPLAFPLFMGIAIAADILLPHSVLAQSIQSQLPTTQHQYDDATEAFQQGDYTRALQLYQQELNVYRDNSNREREGETLHKIGATYYRLNQYDEALDFYQQALTLRQALSDLPGIGSTLNGIAVVYHERGDYDRALEYYQQALEIRHLLLDKPGELRTLNNIGLLYENRGEYASALDNYDRALALARELELPREEGALLNNLGGVYQQLGQYRKALDFYHDALDIARELEDRLQQGKITHNIALVSDELGDGDRAVGFYQEALEIRRAIDDRSGIASTLNNLGLLYSQRNRSTDAASYLEEALAIFKELGDRAGESRTLDSLGTLYLSLGNNKRALEVYQQSFVIQRNIGDRAGQIITLNNLASVLEKRGEIELAILFYKESVNLTETTRQEIQALAKDLRESYTSTIAQTYRHLADLLLQQDRVLEAQQVLDLLKIQEIDNYLQDSQDNRTSERSIDKLPPEGEIWASYSTLLEDSIALDRELNELHEIYTDDRTEAQKTRIAELMESQQQMMRQFNQLIESDRVSQLLNELSRTQSLGSVGISELSDRLQDLQSDAAVLYPLVLYDRLELILVTPNALPIHKSVSVTSAELNKTIAEFRESLQDPTLDATQPARQLYQWLIEPLESALNGVETIVYAPDSQLRYIPLAALYDGDRWLVERFRINNITAASLTNFSAQSPSDLHLLAGAFANGFYSFQVGDRAFNLRGLSHAETEVQALAETIHDTTLLVDREFSPEATVAQMDNYTIAHFATHAAFIPGHPADSFIMFGNGDRVTLQDVKNNSSRWSFRNLDLVVLSACETGLGELGNGEEILGFGYLMQDAGAKASIASLWTVSDGSTQVLMNAFYQSLQQGLSKAESLRQAQIALITGRYLGSGEERSVAVKNYLEHPYYWAPFILIGNGL